MATSGITPILAPGFVSIYGAASIYGFTGMSDGLSFGRVYKLSGSPSGNYSLGQNVLFPVKDAPYVQYSNTTYYIVDETKIILTEQQSPEDIS